jgi:hypothetical protein
LTVRCEEGRCRPITILSRCEFVHFIFLLLQPFILYTTTLDPDFFYLILLPFRVPPSTDQFATLFVLFSFFVTFKHPSVCLGLFIGRLAHEGIGANMTRIPAGGIDDSDSGAAQGCTASFSYSGSAGRGTSYGGRRKSVCWANRDWPDEMISVVHRPELSVVSLYNHGYVRS